jgi:PAS domain S-box-containing protein
MKKLEKSIKKRYFTFISLIICIMLAILFFVQASINAQILDSELINIAGRQRTLSQRIAKLAFAIGYVDDSEINSTSVNTLNLLIKEWDSLHQYLQTANIEQGRNVEIDTLLGINEIYFNQILTSSGNLTKITDVELTKQAVDSISEAEKPYLKNIDKLIKEYQKIEEKRRKELKTIIYFLVFGTFLLLLGGFLTVLRPAFLAFVKKNKETRNSLKELALSKNKTKENLVELKGLKADLEVKETYNKIFIEQAPTAIAMLDNNMCYIAASKKWISDYKMEDEEIVGRSHYDLFPEIGDDWKANHQKCLNGVIDKCDEAPFVRKDGSVQWIFWDVRPWYVSEGNIGGLVMHTGDITHVKENEEERIRIEKILEKTNEIARIGTWDMDFIKDNIFWSEVIYEIYEAPDGFIPDLETVTQLFKEGQSRNLIKKVIDEAIEYGTPYDVELELVTFKGNSVWTRAIGQAEIVDGTCVRLFGMFQDINDEKIIEIDLGKAHAELHSVFDSEIIGMVSTDADGIITHFNRGAEILTGYSASEIIGLQRPKFYHLEEELDAFRIDVAKLYGKNPTGLNPSLELSKHNAYDTREWTYLRKDGTTIPVQLTLTSIKDEDNNLIG